MFDYPYVVRKCLLSWGNKKIFLNDHLLPPSPSLKKKTTLLIMMTTPNRWMRPCPAIFYLSVFLIPACVPAKKTKH